MSKKSIAIVVVAVVIFVAILILAAIKGPFGTISPGAGNGSENNEPNTRETLPRNVVIVVPEKDSENVPENIAVPEQVSSAGPARGDSKYRVFNIKITSTSFEPDTIIVKVGDTVRIVATSEGGSYDLFQPDYGFKVASPNGESKFIQFDATAEGRFVFFCQSCGGPDSGPKGSFVVAPKE